MQRPRSWRSMVVIDGMNAFDLARVCHVDSALAQAWIDHDEEPGAAALGTLRSVITVMEGLSRNGLTDPEDRIEWLRNPNRAFGHEAPIDLLSRGEIQPLLDYIDRLS